MQKNFTCFIFLFLVILFVQCTNEQIEYYETGEVSARYQLRNGNKDGIERRYYPSGKLLSEREWRDGKLEDRVIHYYESGDTLEIQLWNNGKKQGNVIRFHPNGVQSLLANFIDDKRVGKIIFYKEDGTIEKIDTYDRNGRITHSEKYDGKGNIVDNEPFLILEPQTDTLLIDRNNTFEARFVNYDSSINVGFHFGPLDFKKNYVELKDTLDIVKKVGSKYLVHIHPKLKGSYPLTGLYYYEMKGNGDTLSFGRVFVYDKKFYVK